MLNLMNTTQTAATETTVHPFERAGLGKAPFRFDGMAQQDLCYGEVMLNRAEYERTGIALTTKRGGTCAYCGAAIVNMCNIVSADGKRFHVGCDCVSLTGDSNLVRKVKAATLAADRKKRAARAETVKAELSALLADETARASLAALPHPTASRAAQGETLLSSLEWLAERAGAAGRARALKAARAALAAK
jgi:hypothetical protein